MRQSTKSPELYIGPAGWSYDDWKGIVYPKGMTRDFDPLEYIAQHFDVVEINSSFYRPMPPRWARSWVRRVEGHPRFKFTAKLWRRFTHDRSSPPTEDDITTVRNGIDVLAEEDRLLSLLLQFPWSFRNRPSERRWLASVCDAFAEYPLSLEVRHVSWDDDEVKDWLTGREIAFVAIDQPLHQSSLGPVELLTAPIAYYRFHGRNYRSWFAEGRPSHERYDYLYETEELMPWADRIKAVAGGEAETVIAITNNHYQGKAVVNALQLKAWTEEKPVLVPGGLLDVYPEALASVNAEASKQGDLFEA